MKLTFLGAGDGFSVGQGHNSALLEFGGTNLCIDFPESNHAALHKLGLELNRVENVFVTHLHEDHINGLQKLAFYHGVYPLKGKPRLFVHEELLGDLWDALRHGLAYSTRGPKELSDFFEVVPVQEAFELEGQRFELVRTVHIPGMISFGLLCAPYFYFSGDTRFDLGQIEEAAAKAKVLFYECHMQPYNLPSHTSLDELLTLPEELQRRTVLMHYLDDYLDAEKREAFHNAHALRLAELLQAYEF
ncbi:beta-lactamase domain-containing protein [Paenibacillus mucilaginosus 3016]|uniref:Beta-lactamase domain-containing protein n=1 Tax=Paenibacillus mucilaginosus 3016 TaxID=1116391 RepID=H6NFB6_9BACL|nr:MBL fold metallo-hydrolase [Paenibacillus mucilaginosus]AFC29525.1 beta-lactamase domain-containing protein [Paenibacillus mucilaginosus 3016]WFA18224.1 ribonuclease Z [Paenibacillus mucilaginosus]